MLPTAPSALDSATLSRRLGELAGDERQALVAFLLHLDEFDRRRAYLEEGHESLWAFCQRALHLREGPAALRITAMRALRRLPALAEALRDGRLCLTTVRLLEPILADENAAEIIARASYKTKAEVERLVVTIQPRSSPKDGVRKLPGRPQAVSVAAPPLEATLPLAAALRRSMPASQPGMASSATDDPAARKAVAAAIPALAAAPTTPVRAPASRPTVEPVAADTYSIRVTVDAAFKDELDQLKSLLSHKIPNGELRDVLREAVRCAIEKHGKRRGAVEPKTRRAPAPELASSDDGRGKASSGIPAEVRREVWKRDKGRCTWRGRDGRRCESTWRLELDHIHPAGLGGPSTVGNTRLLCAAHNMLHAEQTYGREHMAQFRRGEPRTGEAADSGMSDGHG